MSLTLGVTVVLVALMVGLLLLDADFAHGITRLISGS